MQNITVKKAKNLRDFGFVSYIRTSVYIIEQDCPCLEEFDEKEDEAVHYLGWVDGNPVTTCRILFPQDGLARIGRIATLENHRGKGYASKLIKEMIAMIRKDRTIEEIQMSAQDHALGLYEKLGFKTFGEGYLSSGIPHHMMSLSLRRS